MKFTCFLFALILLTGCCALNPEERTMLRTHNVSPAVIRKMENWEKLSMNDIVELCQCRVPSKLTIHYLRSTSAMYNMDQASLARLKQVQCPPEIVLYLVETSIFMNPDRPEELSGYGYNYVRPKSER